MIINSGSVLLLFFGNILLVSLVSASGVGGRTAPSLDEHLSKSPADVSRFNGFKLPFKLCDEAFMDTSDDGYLDKHYKNVHAQVLSPEVPQSIRLKANKVYLNNELLVRNSKRLSSKPAYLKATDGSLWYTNLPVGQPMAADEVQRFKNEVKKIQEEDIYNTGSLSVCK